MVQVYGLTALCDCPLYVYRVMFIAEAHIVTMVWKTSTKVLFVDFNPAMFCDYQKQGLSLVCHGFCFNATLSKQYPSQI